MSAAARTVAAVTCLGCGCACDDIEIVVLDDRIAEARRACTLGARWFGDGVVPRRVRVGGRDASVADAIDAAARLLGGAARPLVYLAPDIPCEAQREAIALADALHALADSVTSETAMRSVLAAQERGRASATLGEIRNRADVVLFWGVDPALRYPRYLTRYAPDPAGRHVPDGRRSRTIVAADIGDARGPADADRRVEIAPADEVATLTLLRAEVESPGAGTRPRNGTPVPDPGTGRREVAGELASMLAAGRYVAIVADAEPEPGRDPGRAEALIALAQALNGRTRCALSTLRAGGNRSGADACLTWQTGYPAAVDFSRGFPVYRPHDAAATRLARGDVDAVLVAGAAALLPPGLLQALSRVPGVVVGPKASEQAPAGAIAIDTGIAGIHEAGTALRMDEVPLPLRPVLGVAQESAAVLRALRARVAELAS